MEISFTVLTTIGALPKHSFATVTKIVLMVQMNDTISVCWVAYFALDKSVTVALPV